MDFLEKKLIELEDFNLEVYDLVLVGVILGGGVLLYFGVTGLFKRAISKKGKADSGKLSYMNQITKYLIGVAIAILLLESFGVNVTLLIAGSTALLVGVGLGLQSTFNDLVGGLILFFEGSIQIGDVIEIDNLVGEVQHIGLRTSKIETRENIMLIIPNSKLVVNNLNNWSHNIELMRFSVKVGVDYSSDIDKVRKILLNACHQVDGIDLSKSPFVRFIDFGNSSLDFELFFFSKHKMWVEDIKSQVRFKIRKAFIQHQIKIPFPQRDLHIIGPPAPFKESAQTPAE